MNENHCSAKHTVQLKSVAVCLPAPPEEACRLLPDSTSPRHTGIAEEEKTRSISAPRTVAVNSPELLREHDFPVHWALLCSLTIRDLPQQMHKTSFSSSLLSQRQVLYWEVYSSCWVNVTPVQSLPDFQSFFLISSALNFLISSKKTQAVFVSLFQTGGERKTRKQRAVVCCSAGLITP